MSTGYDNSKLRQYLFQAVDFGGSDVTHVIAAPLAGRNNAEGTPPTARGRVRGYMVFEVSEIFAGSSSAGGIEVGDGTTPDLYFQDDLPLNGLATTEARYAIDNGDAVDIPADAVGDITITVKASVGTPTGIADLLVDVEWFDL